MANIEQLEKTVNQNGMEFLKRMYDLSEIDHDYLLEYVNSNYPQFLEPDIPKIEEKPKSNKPLNSYFPKYDRQYDEAFIKYPDLELDLTPLEEALIDEDFKLKVAV